MKVINGNNIDILKEFPDNYFDAVVTDPPYGLGKEPDAVEVMKAWIETGHHEVKGTGFMAKIWDAFVPQPLFWKEVFRVLKPGGHVVAFYGTRTYDWGVMAMRFAGFEVRDSIYWHYGCLSDDTEILTENGWVQYKNYHKKGSILVYNPLKDEYLFEEPEKWNEYTIQDTCYRIESDKTSQIVSRNHRCLVELEGVLLFEYAEALAQKRQATIPILESNDLRIEQTQAIRMGRSYSTTLATITPIEYSGVIFCPTVSTGAFVARRNGKIFLTGNSGFPKSHNIGKAIDRLYGHEIENKSEFTEFSKTTDTTKHIQRYKKCTECGKLLFGQDPCACDWRKHNGISEDAKKYEGFGSALKPASEPIVLARKPLEKGLSIAENVLKWGTGGIAIDKCRVSTDEKIENHSRSSEAAISKGKYGDSVEQETHQTDGQKLGRFPANLVLSHHSECTLNGLKKVKGIIGGTKPVKGNYKLSENKTNQPYFNFADENGEETIEDWTCHENCPIRMMDEQSGNLKSGKAEIGMGREGNFTNGIYGAKASKITSCYADSGGASRFFPHLNYEADEYNRFLYTAKASKSERNKGLDKERWFYDLELIFDKCSFTKQNLFIWEQEALNQNMDLNGEVRQKKDTSEGIVLLVEGKECYTTLFGNEKEVLFPKAIKFTTSTGISQTIELKTLNFYQPLSISDCIADVIETQKANGLSLAENVGMKNLLKQIFTKDKSGFLLGVKVVAKKMPQLINVKDVWQKSNIHSTVKPVKLMQWLVRLITPPNGIVLDPFGGSGTTGIACKIEGFDCVLIEQDAEYCKIAEARIENWVEDKPKKKIADQSIPEEPNKDENKDKFTQLPLF